MLETKNKRIEETLKIIKKNGRVNIVDLSKKFNVTKMTIYRDLKKLERKNIIAFIRNGAIYIDNDDYSDLPTFYRSKLNIAEKKLIAKAAINFINNDETIFLDGSTTSLQLAKQLSKLKDLRLTILTGSPLIANEIIRNENIELINVGGTLNRTNYTYYSSHLKEILIEININKCFISCKGFSIKNGYTEAIKDEALFKMAIIEKCNEVNILADHSKYNIVSTYSFGNLNIAKRIIVDNKMAYENIKELKKDKIDIIVSG